MTMGSGPNRESIINQQGVAGISEEGEGGEHLVDEVSAEETR